jgi:hypothetical protein
VEGRGIRDAVDEVRRDEGTRPVVDEDDPIPSRPDAAVQLVEGIERGEPGRDRLLPPRTTTVATTAGGSHPPAASHATRSGGATRTIRSTRGAAEIASSVHARSGRPATGAASLSPAIIRVLDPAATTITSTPADPGASSAGLIIRRCGRG